MLEWFKFLDVTKIDNQSIAGQLIQFSLPPLVIIIINNILLYFIYYSAYWEKHTTHSAYQYSILNKSFIYLGLNMLVIPAISLTSTSADTIIKVFENKNFNVIDMMASFHKSDNGLFFVMMLLQCACFSIASGLIRQGEIAYSFFSPRLSHYRRKYLSD